MFTVFNSYLLRPFAVRDPYSLYQFGWITRSQNFQSFGWRDFERFRNGNTVFSEASANTAVSPSLDNGMLPGPVGTLRVTARLWVAFALDKRDKCRYRGTA